MQYRMILKMADINNALSYRNMSTPILAPGIINMTNLERGECAPPIIYT